MSPPPLKLSAQTRVHLVGIAGTGLSAIARVLLERGIPVSGSDRALNAVTTQLEAMGATIYAGHRAENISGAALVLVTSAAKDDNPEIAAARAAGIPVLKRRDFLPLLLADDKVIALAGTHGKTTTTAMVAHTLREIGVNPGYIVGSVMENSGTNASGGSPNAPFAIEADEYDDMYLGLTPKIAVLTSVEWDHPDFFPTEHDMVQSFNRFIHQILPDGALIANADTLYSRALARTLQETGRRVVLYGLNRAESDWFIHDLRVDENGLTHFEAVERATLTSYHFKLRVHGAHNALNALGAALALMVCGVPLKNTIKALESFKSTGRRFQVVGETRKQIVIDDYGHHPSAIRLTLEAARLRYPNHKVWAVWQPHTFSRIQALLSDYAQCFSAADGVAVMDIYASREQPNPNLNGQIVAAQVGLYHSNAHYTGDIPSTIAALKKRVKGKSVIIVFSAGDATAVSAGLVADA